MLEVNESVMEGSSISACVSVVGVEPIEREIVVTFSTVNQNQQGTCNVVFSSKLHFATKHLATTQYFTFTLFSCHGLYSCCCGFDLHPKLSHFSV